MPRCPSSTPAPSLSLGGGKVILKPWKMKGGFETVFKTQSPESALPKELLRPGTAWKDGGLGEDGGWGCIEAVGPDSEEGHELPSYHLGARRQDNHLIPKLVNTRPLFSGHRTDALTQKRDDKYVLILNVCHGYRWYPTLLRWYYTVWL